MESKIGFQVRVSIDDSERLGELLQPHELWGTQLGPAGYYIQSRAETVEG
jgi:hypothetical protein